MFKLIRLWYNSWNQNFKLWNTNYILPYLLFALVFLFYGISIFVGYLMLKPFL